jgi:ParB family chromosome partitioning protein
MAKWKATSVASQIDYQRPIKKIPISMIKEIGWVPKRRNLGDIASLAKSMMVKGDVEVPVKVRPSRDGLYELVWGWRRYQAAKLAGLNEISCIVDNVSDAELFRQMAIENLLREDRNIVEEAELFRLWSSKTGKSYEEIARDLGINPRYIYNRVELLSLPQPIIEKLKSLPQDRIKLLHLLYLKRVKDPVTQEAIFKRYLEEGWTVRELRNVIEKFIDVESVSNKSPHRSQARQIYDLTVYGNLEELTSPLQSCVDDQRVITSRCFTHFDHPSAILNNGKSLAGYPPSKFVGRCTILDVRCSSESDVITLKRVKEAAKERYIQAGEMVFFYTGWAQHHGTEQYILHPSISLDVAEWLVEKQVSIFGIDMPNPSRLESRKFHEILLSNDILLLENLGVMKDIVGLKVKAIALPTIIKDLPIAPARVVVRKRRRRGLKDDGLY